MQTLANVVFIIMLVDTVCVRPVFFLVLFYVVAKLAL